MKKEYEHIPVMLKEVLEVLDPRKGQFYIDGTLGGGGYTFALAERVGERGGVLSIDLDDLAIDNAHKKIEENNYKNIVVVKDNFRNLKGIIEENLSAEVKFDGVVLDLGLSSAQLEDDKRGFSYKKDAPLDMFFGEYLSGRSPFYAINETKTSDLVRIFKKYGEEKFASRIAKEIEKERKTEKIESTKHLVGIIERSIPKKFAKDIDRIKSRIFQALRVWSNEELESLQEVLPQIVEVLKKGGKMAIVTYHSLEDRIVKNFMQYEAKECHCPPEIPVCRCEHVAKLEIENFKINGKRSKFLTPSEEEINKNPRSRSAKLRAATII